MAQPHRTASGVVTESPLVLVDLESDAGIVGHGPVFTYTAAALTPVAGLVANLEPLVKGQPLAPETLTRSLLARFGVTGWMEVAALAAALACRSRATCFAT